MDPITQTALGSAMAAALCWKPLGRWSLLLGAAGGALADVDVAWGFLADPALPWEFHRQMTHSLWFIPIGGLLAALPFFFFKAFDDKKKQLCWAATVGYATHAVLDASTAWGTYLYWPFSHQRVAWDWISVVDPIFTLLLLLGILITVLRPKGWTVLGARFGLMLSMIYMCFGIWQHDQLLGDQQRLALQRGHQIERSRVMPTLGNTLIWRSIYECDGVLYCDVFRKAPFAESTLKVGSSKELYSIEASKLSARQADILKRFSHFADAYLVQQDKGFIGDQRYSYTAGSFDAIWGLRLVDDDIEWFEPKRKVDGLLPELWRAVVHGDGF